MIEAIRSRLEAYAPRPLPPGERPLAAVLLPLYAREDGLHVVLTKRTDKVQNHKGEISFPGGAMETRDPDVLRTALRESDEEIGLSPGDVRVIGRLDDIFSISGFHVSAFVGEVDPLRTPYAWRPQAHEVAEVLEVPLPHLLDPVNLVEVPRQRNGTLILMEGCRWNDHVVWGMTWRLLRHFLDVAVAGLGEASLR